MKIDEIKKGIYNTFLTKPMDDKIDEMIISCLMYDYLKKIVANETNLQNNMKNLADTYLDNFKKILTTFKVTYLSYSQMREEISAYKKNSFLEFTSTDISKIIKLYQERIKILPFSTTYFSQYMYRVTNIKNHQYIRLAEIHEKVMKPIIKYYIDGYGAIDSDLEIVSALGSLNNPGKEIIFSIKDIDPARVVNDIITKRIPISYYSVKVYKNYVKILTN